MMSVMCMDSAPTFVPAATFGQPSQGHLRSYIQCTPR